ncbi:MBOAT family protein [Myxococcota bacterium]|nr:MBOAT family protein [Myxococcota bacterium]
MIFSQIEYLFFFVTVFTLHWLLPRRLRVPFLFFTSLAFYGSWNARYLLLILGSTLIDFVAGDRIYKSKSDQARNRWLLASLIANIGSLAVFKYFNFFIESVASLLSALGLQANLPTLNVLLPVGISFYTFQSMSYTIDIWRREREPEESLLLFATYVSFFPQLVAGPIVRAGELLGQLKSPPSLSVDKVKRAGKYFLWGLIKKNIFADLVAVKCVDVVFSDPSRFDTPTLWLAALGYSLQIYADFSGYTDMARGSALLLGYELPENFRTPYRARSITAFWQRWHISLSGWLRDYLYIALGGNRGGRYKTYRNLMLTMLLGGLWHGAAWTFVVWGGAHGAALALHRAWRGGLGARPALRALQGQAWYGALAGLLTFLFVCLTFVLFRATSFEAAAQLIVHLFIPQGGARAIHVAPLLLIVIFAAGTLLGARVDPRPLYDRVPWPLRALGYALAILALMILTPTSQVPFIYFQF